jgi:lantibiotic leader peptide-processing serine protease
MAPSTARSAQSSHRAQSWLCVACLLVSLACSDRLPVAPTRAVGANAQLPSAARYLVELATSGRVPAPVAANIVAAGGRILRTHEGVGLAVVAGLSASAATALQHQPGVRHVMPDIALRMIHDPVLRRYAGPPVTRGTTHRTTSRGDPRAAQFFQAQWNMTRVRADSAWQVTTQGTGMTVFILDTGADTAHIDLKGLIDIPRSTSFAFASSDTLMQHPLPFSHDIQGHGTFVASIITSNSLGIAAVAPKAHVAVVRVLDDSGQGTSSAVLNGILYATDSGADIINMSIGGYLDRTSGSFLAFADIYQRVVDYATQRGVVLVAAAGNESVNTNTAVAPSGSYGDSLNTPAGLHHVMSVGATGPVNQTSFDQIATYSNFGDSGVGVFAPGGNDVDTAQADLVLGACSSATTLCPNQENMYLIGAGTSFATPMAAGEAAVVKAQRTGAISGGSLEMCVLVSASDITGHRPDINYNFGRIDVVNALGNSSCKSGT